jgi:hypothetical protein
LKWIKRKKKKEKKKKRKKEKKKKILFSLNLFKKYNRIIK